MNFEISFEDGVSHVKLFFIPVTSNGGSIIVKDINGTIFGVHRNEAEAQIMCNKYFIPKGIKPRIYYHMVCTQE